MKINRFSVSQKTPSVFDKMNKINTMTQEFETKISKLKKAFTGAI